MHQLALRDSGTFLVIFDFHCSFLLFITKSSTRLFFLDSFLVIGEIHDLIAMLKAGRGRAQGVLIRVISDNRIMYVRLSVPALVLPQNRGLGRHVDAILIGFSMEAVETVDPPQIATGLLAQCADVVCVVYRWIGFAGQLGVV